MRSFLSVALGLLAPLALAANDHEFGGAWVASLCAANVPRESGQCANFVLELHQQDHLLCGAHFFATAGAERVDEGAAPSVIGTVANGVATVDVISGRATPPVRLRVELRRGAAALHSTRYSPPRVLSPGLPRGAAGEAWLAALGGQGEPVRDGGQGRGAAQRDHHGVGQRRGGAGEGLVGSRLVLGVGYGWGS